MSDLIFLGTGTSQGIPVISCKCRVCLSNDPRDKRLRSSVLVETGGVNIVIDCGPDFRQQMLREGVDRLDAILFTHDHRDHIAGLDDVRAFNHTSGREIDIYAEDYVQKSIRREFGYAFAEDKYPGVPEINLVTITDEPFDVKGVRVTPVRGKHLRLPVLGFRIGGMCYITDMNSIEKSELEKIKRVGVLVINALREEPHLSHFSLSEALAVIEEVKPGKAYLTHVSHQMGLHAEMPAKLPAGVHFAFDGLKVNFYVDTP